jgi:hypothetical protein
MDAKLNLYDFLAYIIPGAIVVSLLLWFSIACLSFPLPSSVSTSDTVTWLLFLAISYFLGHVVQSAGAQYEEKTEKRRGWLSEKFLQDDHSRYTSEYKKCLKESIERVFNLLPDVHPTHRDTQKRRQQEMFYLCGAVIRQETDSNEPDVLRSICALYRSLYIVVWVGFILSVLVALKHFVFWVFTRVNSSLLPKVAFFRFDGVELFLGIFIAAFCFWSTRWLQSRWYQYTEYYVDSVYTNFYTWYCKKYGQQTTKTSDKKDELEKSNTPS